MKELKVVDFDRFTKMRARQAYVAGRRAPSGDDYLAAVRVLEGLAITTCAFRVFISSMFEQSFKREVARIQRGES